MLFLLSSFSRTRGAAERAPSCDYGVGVRVGRRRLAELWGHHDWRERDQSAVRVHCYEVSLLTSRREDGSIRQFKGRTPPPSTRFRAFLADGAATTGALASGSG